METLPFQRTSFGCSVFRKLPNRKGFLGHTRGWSLPAALGGKSHLKKQRGLPSLSCGKGDSDPKIQLNRHKDHKEVLVVELIVLRLEGLPARSSDWSVVVMFF